MPKVVSQKEVIEKTGSRNCRPVDLYDKGWIPMKFLCLIHNHEYVSTYRLVIDNKMDSNKCPICANEKRQKLWDSFKLSNEDIDSRLLKIHSGKILRDSKIKGRHTKISWKCNVCNFTWQQTPGNVIHENNPTGCPNCNKSKDDTKESFMDKLIIAGRKDVLMVGDYKGSEVKTEFKCLRCESQWGSRPANILNLGRGCPLCKNKSEKCVGDMLREIGYNIKHNHYIRYNNKRMLVDWYIDSKKIMVEYNGLQHYQPVTFGRMSSEAAEIKFKRQCKRDILLKEWCELNKITLIEIDGRKFTYRNPEKMKEYIINTINEVDICIN